mmetsp:Transcript_16897/g.33012  ORF Transcript_16897/g.33012 Transcript_16897/m.33012 type:complete len:248 (+) Transcript_16897:1311-2054(+)
MGSAAQRRQISRISAASEASTETMAPGHCLTMRHNDSRVRCKSSSSAACIRAPSDARTPCSKRSDSFKEESSQAVRKRQNDRHAQTRTTNGSPGAIAEAQAFSNVGKSPFACMHTTSPSLRSTANARARRNSGVLDSAHSRHATSNATGTSSANSPRCKDFGWTSPATLPKMKSATSTSFHSFAALPAARFRRSAVSVANARPLSRRKWPRSSPIKLSPESLMAHPRTKSSSSWARNSFGSARHAFA